MLTQEELKSFLNYDRNTGIFTYIKPTNPRTKIGQVAGTSNGKGYLKLKYKKESYYLHRLVFLYIDNIMLNSKQQVDHINHDVADNRYENLRLCSQEENMYNSRVHRDNVLGLKHITKTKDGKRYKVRMTIEGKPTYIGEYRSLEIAKSIAEQKRKHHHKEFACS